VGTRDLEIVDCAGHLAELSKDQHGSRFIQQKLEVCNDATKETVFDELIPHALSIVDDLFGNYVMQKLLVHGSPDQRMRVVKALHGQTLELSCKMYGCRVIQKAFETLDQPGRLVLVDELKSHVEKLVHDQNGNHVIQRCIQTVRPLSSIRFILDPFRNHIPALSRHPFGCRVVQRVLENFTDSVDDVWVLAEVIEQVDKLIEDQYGNYVVQHVLEHGQYSDKMIIAESVRDSLLRLCRHKFGSNIVELVMKNMKQDFVEGLIDIMLVPDPNSDSGSGDMGLPLEKMMTDSFANYVVQRVIRMANPTQLEVIRQCITLQADVLRNYSYGKHILACLKGQDRSAHAKHLPQ
jgi:pumilio RNA-binding family